VGISSDWIKWSGRGLGDRLNVILAIVALALGIGVNVTIFSLTYSVLIRPLPYPDADRIVAIKENDTAGSDGNTKSSWLTYSDLLARNHTLDKVGAYAIDASVISLPSGATTIGAFHVTPNFFEILGVKPFIGRPLSSSDISGSSAPVVLLSYHLWASRFASQSNALGKLLRINGTPYTIIGVLPQTFHFGTNEPDTIWLPYVPSTTDLSNRNFQVLNIIGFLKNGVTPEVLRADLTLIASQLRNQYSSELSRQFSLTAQSYQSSITSDLAPLLVALNIVLLVVLFLACANSSTLMLSRWLSRSQALAVRAALGATRRDLIMLIGRDAFRVALCGCILGIFFAKLCIAAIQKMPPDALPPSGPVGLNLVALLYCSVLGLVTTVTSALIPAIASTRIPLQSLLNTDSRNSTSGTAKRRFIKAAVICEIASSSVLLVITGLALHNFYNVSHATLGFRPENVITFDITPPDPANFYANDVKAQGSIAASRYRPILEALRTLPGVRYVGLTSTLPLDGTNFTAGFSLPGLPNIEKKPRRALISAVSEGYIEALGIPLLSGRSIAVGDTESTPHIALINQRFADQYFSGKSPLGEQITVGDLHANPDTYRIVGVVGNVIQDRVGDGAVPVLYLPYQQLRPSGFWYPFLIATGSSYVISRSPRMSSNSDITAAVKSQCPTCSLQNLRSMQTVISDATLGQQWAVYFISFFAALAVAIVCVGLYGITVEYTRTRYREFGIRIALGANRLEIAELVLRQAGILLGAGSVIGLAGSIFLGKLLGTLLFGVRAIDPLTYIGVFVGLLIIGIVSCSIPVCRVFQIRPTDALRAE